MKQIYSIILLVITSLVFASGWDAHGNSPRSTTNAALSVLPQERVGFPWQQTNCFGGDATSVVESPLTPGRLFAAVGEAYVSSDFGNHWQRLTTLSQLNNIRCFATSSTAIFAGGHTSSGLYVSNDDGETWQNRALPEVGRSVIQITVDPTNEATIFLCLSDAFNATTSELILKSTDAGSTWNLLSTPAIDPTYGCADIAINPQNPSQISAACYGAFGGGALLMSSDGGASWEEASVNLPNNPLYSVCWSSSGLYVAGGQPFGSQSVGVWQYDQTNSCWIDLSLDFPCTYVSQIRVHPENPMHLFAATARDGLYRSTDGGQNWDYNTIGADSFNMQSFSFSPHTPEMLFSASQSMAVYRSEDNGASWDAANGGISRLSISDITVDPSDSNHWLLAFVGTNNGGCLESLDAGQTWRLMSTLPATRYSKVAIGTDGTLYAASSGPSDVAQEGIYASCDGGTTWQNLGPNLGTMFELDIADFRILPTSPLTMVCSGNHYGNMGWDAVIYRSSDAGTSWELTYSGPADNRVQQLSCFAAPFDSFIAAAEFSFNEGCILLSADYGTSWQNCTEDLTQTIFPRTIVADPINPGNLYFSSGVYGSGTVWHSQDFGNAWQQCGSLATSVDMIMHPANSEIFYAATQNNGVLLSQNSTASWQTAGNGVNALNMAGLSEPYLKDDQWHILLATKDAGLYSTPLIDQGFGCLQGTIVNMATQLPQAGIDFSFGDLTLTSGIDGTFCSYAMPQTATVFCNPDGFVPTSFDVEITENNITACSIDLIPLMAPPDAIQATPSGWEVTLSWQASEYTQYLTGYRILRNGIELATVPEATTLYTDDSIAQTGTYSYSIESCYGALLSSPSDPIVIELTSAGMPLVPQHVQCSIAPNPFNPQTTISLSLPSSEMVTIELFNAKGQRIIQLHQGYLDAGSHQFVWEGIDEENNPVTSGCYFCAITTSTTDLYKKLMIIK
jgi:photosystem II stability/assembly factor-like uncharacterized protein